MIVVIFQHLNLILFYCNIPLLICKLNTIIILATMHSFIIDFILPFKEVESDYKNRLTLCFRGVDTVLELGGLSQR